MTSINEPFYTTIGSDVPKISFPETRQCVVCGIWCKRWLKTKSINDAGTYPYRIIVALHFIVITIESFPRKSLPFSDACPYASDVIISVLDREHLLLETWYCPY